MPNPSRKRVLAIDPYSRGVGFAVLEGPENLIDWGLKTTGKASSAKATRKIEALIARFQPDILALEDWDADGSRRCGRIEKLLTRIAATQSRNISVRLAAPRQLRLMGPRASAGTKYGRACLIADRFPELKPFLPPVRKPWMSEDDRMSIFDATSFALSYYLALPPEPSPNGHVANNES